MTTTWWRAPAIASMIVVGGALIISNVGSHIEALPPAPPVGPIIATSGTRAVANIGPVVACPEWEDYTQLIADLGASDRVGFNQHLRQGNCTMIAKGETGLVIGAGLFGLQVRLDRDEKAYWTGHTLADGRPVFVCIDNSACGRLSR
jgi:hypothetical protein